MRRTRSRSSHRLVSALVHKARSYVGAAITAEARADTTDGAAGRLERRVNNERSFIQMLSAKQMFSDP